MKNNFRIGIALGSGAARGLAHIGVIETLKKYNIDFDLVSGSSIGALIGALYCYGMEFKYIEALCKNLQTKTYLDVSVPRIGFIKGVKVQELIKFITRDCEFGDLKTPMIVVATDLKNKKIKIIEEGKVHEAIRASISVPGVFVPYYKDDMVLVDGGVLERVPAKILKDRGMDFVIGVDVGFNLKTSSCKSIFHVLYESIDLMERELFNLKKQEADFMIRVDLDDIDPTKFDQVDFCIQRGREATENIIVQLKEAIENSNIRTEL